MRQRARACALLCEFLSLISTSLPSGELLVLTGPVMKLSCASLLRHAHTRIRAHARKRICINVHRNSCVHSHIRYSLRESATHMQAYRDTWSSRTSCLSWELQTAGMLEKPRYTNLYTAKSLTILKSLLVDWSYFFRVIMLGKMDGFLLYDVHKWLILSIRYVMSVSFFPLADDNRELWVCSSNPIWCTD